MLTTQYINALNGFKSQAQSSQSPQSSHLFNGCEAEAQHIYRIIMTENIPVTELDQKRLEAFLIKEKSGNADYSKPVDRDGLQYVDIEKDVEVYPCTGQAFLEPIPGETYILSSSDAKSLISQLSEMNHLNVITDTLQSLCSRSDGTNLQTALPQLAEIRSCITSGLKLPEDLIKKIERWELMNCTVLNLDFEELK